MELENMAFLRGMRAYLEENRGALRVLGTSSHAVKEFTFGAREYILKEQILKENALSPFWRMMRDIFGSTFRRQREEIGAVWELLRNNRHIPSARPVLTGEGYTVFEKMPGESWEPDEFPEDEELCRELGLFIGFNHTLRFPRCGRIPCPNIGNLEERILEYAKREVPEEDVLWELLERARKNPVYSGPFVPVMTDISANQFLFQGNRITACVDLDAYVIGPPQWELEVLRLCVPCWKAFSQGYETYQNLPPASAAGEVFRYLMR